jgi:hypothetical protein
MNRAGLHATVYPLGEEPGDDLRQHTSPAERLTLVAELTREMWTLTGREIPSYARSDMPVAVVPLRKREE